MEGDGAGPDWMGGGTGLDRTRPDQTGWLGGRARATSAEQRLPIKDHGPGFGTNEHPRRDTDVILRQSKARIEIFNLRSVL